MKPRVILSLNADPDVPVLPAETLEQPCAR